MDSYNLDIYFWDSSEPVTTTIKADSEEEADKKSQFWIEKFKKVDFYYYELTRR